MPHNFSLFAKKYWIFILELWYNISELHFKKIAKLLSAEKLGFSSRKTFKNSCSVAFSQFSCKDFVLVSLSYTIYIHLQLAQKNI